MATYIFAGGGSAGHALPGIRIAETMRGQGHKAVFVGSRASIEERLCAHHGIPFHAVTTGRLNRARMLSVLRRRVPHPAGGVPGACRHAPHPARRRVFLRRFRQRAGGAGRPLPGRANP